MHPIRFPKRLIALLLEDVNVASACESSTCHGHQRKLNLGWARPPFAMVHMVLLAQMVNHPGYVTEQRFAIGVNKQDAANIRGRSFATIQESVAAGQHLQRRRAKQRPVSIAFWENGAPGLIQPSTEAVHP